MDKTLFTALKCSLGMNTVLATLETSGGSIIKRRKLNISLSTWPVFSFRRDFKSTDKRNSH